MKRIDVSEIARENHALWLQSNDRSYSPFGKPWDLLTDRQKWEASRTVVNTLEILWKHGLDVPYTDDLLLPPPEEAGKTK